MIADLQPYALMKDSGVSCLGMVPNHWAVVPLCAIGHPRKQTGRPHSELLSVYLGRGVIPFSAVDEKRTNPTSEDLSNYQVVEPGDFVLNNQQAWRGSVGISRHEGIVSPAYLVLSVGRQLLPEFGDRLLSSPAMVAQYLVSSKGVGSIQRNLYWPYLKRVAVPLPPPSEQEAIASFLHYADRTIRRYMRAKQKLIKLLEEQRHAIIHRAVTCGLDPNVRLKPSGVEGLGDIPEHWEVVLNQRIFKENIRPHYDKPEIPLSLSQRDGLVASTELKERSLQTSTYENWKLTLPGDLVVNRFKAHLGVFFAATLRGIVSFHYGVFEPKRALVPKYFEYLYHTNPYRAIYAGRSNGMTVGLQNLSNQNFYGVKSVVPPIAEQRAIVAHADQTTTTIESAKDRALLEIELLREYRTRLIADVVTGKLDVRAASAGLAHKVDNPDPLGASELFDDGDELPTDEAKLEEVEA